MRSSPEALTGHARRRLQQRGIPAQALEHLMDYGRAAHDHHGARIVYFDHKARQRMERTLGPSGMKGFERQLGIYAVIAADGTVITVGHRHRRIRHH
jgi:hypothetical protein